MIPPRLPLLQLPTPVHRLDRISEDLHFDLWIKRDDLTGFAGGGNKGRKLEYLLPDILASKATSVVTCGALQSNFIRQLGSACRIHNIACHAAVMQLPYDEACGKPGGRELGTENGNVLLSTIFGVQFHHIADGDWQQLYDAADAIAAELEAGGENVYRIPVGGSSALGGYAFFTAGQELAAQAGPFDTIVVASSSGSTQAGLAYAFAGTITKVIGFGADTEPDLIDDVLRVGNGLAELLQIPPLHDEAFQLLQKSAQPGYGLRSEDGDAAIQYIAQREGVLLDPIYTGKAFAGLIELAKSGQLTGKVLFWHTGGVPSLFAL